MFLKPLHIYFADLTHDTVGLATEVFPLNVGFIAAYAKKMFGDNVDVTLFKYISKLEDAIQRNPPDIIAFSNYPWCHNANKALCKLLAERRPEALRIMGGPNFPHDKPSQKRFLQERPWLDAYVYLDGEVGFANLVSAAFEATKPSEMREVLRDRAVPGCVQLGRSDELLDPGVKPVRIKNLDEIPSPYLIGLMDPFFDARLSPMIQTNRGCPFQCTFCHDGSQEVSLVNSFSLSRVQAEIDYIAERVPKNIGSLFISDLNFGMYKQDLEICKSIGNLQRRVGYPRYIDTSTGKNQKRRIITAIEELGGALRLSLSVQSMDQEVLKNIKRDNIRLDDFISLQPALRKSRMQTATEVILGLPGETLDGHLKGLGDLLDSNVDWVVPYTLMMIHGAELNTPAQREKWDYKTKFRIIPRDFTRLKSGASIIEIEEVAIASNTLPFEDYVHARQMSLLIRWVNNNGYRALLRFCMERKVPIMDLLKSMRAALVDPAAQANSKLAPPKLAKLLADYSRDTVEELWNSPEEIEDFYQDEANFKKLVSGEHGKNLIQTYEAAAYAGAMQELVDCVFEHARLLFANTLSEEADRLKLDEIERYCRGKMFNLFGSDRLDTCPEVDLSLHIDNWLHDIDPAPIEKYQAEQPLRVRFVIKKENFESVEQALDQFGRTNIGLGKTIIRIGPNAMWRQPQYEPAALC